MENAGDKHTLDTLLDGVVSPLKRQLLVLAFISQRMKKMGSQVPVLIGGCALAYYSREVYFTTDIDLACSDRAALDKVLRSIGFVVEGRYWIQHDMNLMVEAPASSLVGEDAPRETIELGNGLECCVIGIEDLLIDRMNACVHWNSSQECEMVDLLISLWSTEIDWDYLLQRAEKPDNSTRERFEELRSTYGS
jgi:hypothetical protein